MAKCPICSASLPPALIVSPDRGQGTPGRFEVAVCGTCGTGVTLPAVGPGDLAAFYPTGYGPLSEPRRGVLTLISKAIRRWQAESACRRPPLAALAGRPPGNGLDVGAGRGDTSVELAARGWRMTAIEPGAQASAHLRERGLDGREGVLATVALKAEHYDFALFQHSLEHTTDPLGDLRAACAALAPGGLVLISVPNFGSWQRRSFGGCWYHLDVPRHRFHFTGAALERALREAGFRDTRLTRSSSSVGLPASLQYRLTGRCMFPHGMRLRVAAGLCALSLPLSWLLDRVAGEADTLHAVARKPGGP